MLGDDGAVKETLAAKNILIASGSEVGLIVAAAVEGVDIVFNNVAQVPLAKDQECAVTFTDVRVPTNRLLDGGAAAVNDLMAGHIPVMCNNLGGTLPNAVFAHTLNLPTIWVPHSYPACAQHAPNEHLLASVAREGLQIMADKPEGELTWKKAIAWADSVGGTLPTRPVAALAFATAKDQFEPTWHWTADEYDGSDAWFQYFGHGDQDTGHISNELRARLVRRISI